jgi:hypothetical protein
MIPAIREGGATRGIQGAVTIRVIQETRVMGPIKGVDVTTGMEVSPGKTVGLGRVSTVAIMATGQALGKMVGPLRLSTAETMATGQSQVPGIEGMGDHAAGNDNHGLPYASTSNVQFHRRGFRNRPI